MICLRREKYINIIAQAERNFDFGSSKHKHAVPGPTNTPLKHHFTDFLVSNSTTRKTFQATMIITHLNEQHEPPWSFSASSSRPYPWAWRHSAIVSIMNARLLLNQLYFSLLSPPLFQTDLFSFIGMRMQKPSVGGLLDWLQPPWRRGRVRGKDQFLLLSFTFPARSCPHLFL